MSNKAKDWQNGEYTIRVQGKRVEASAVLNVSKNGCLAFKRYSATAHCAPEDEFSLSIGVALAMDRLSKQLNEGIKVGDKVKIKDYGLSYTTYVDWIKKNVNDIGLAACYAYETIPENGDTVYVVKAIAPWGTKYEEDKGKMLAYIQEYFVYNGKVGTNQPCYLMRVDGLEKVYE